ncbi:hypothetical protein OR233_004264 [Enterobacter asburiae]|nr:hypothetical protein [Enterobacter asburiae]
MNINIKIPLIFTFLCSALVTWIVIHFINDYNYDHFTCTASYSAIKNDNVLISKNSLIIHGDKGIWMMDGKITHADAKSLFFKLRNNFRFERTMLAYHFYSDKVAIAPDVLTHSSVLSEFLPDILIKEKQSSFFYIYPINKNYIIFSNSMPIMYCKKQAA